MQHNVALIILAAGNSSRLGQPKQLKMHAGKTLLEHALAAGVQSACASVYVVLGSACEKMQELICAQPVTVIHNESWESGMGSSISAGVQQLLSKESGCDAIIISTCDQPFLSSDIFNQLIERHKESPTKIVASAYGGTFGVPVLFPMDCADELAQLSGNEGAKKVIMRHQDKLATVPFPNGDCDIDTEADWQAFLAQTSGSI